MGKSPKEEAEDDLCVFALCTMFAAGSAIAVGPWSNAVLISGIEVDPVGTTGTSTYLRFTTPPSSVPPCGTATTQCGSTTGAIASDTLDV